MREALSSFRADKEALKTILRTPWVELDWLAATSVGYTRGGGSRWCPTRSYALRGENETRSENFRTIKHMMRTTAVFWSSSCVMLSYFSEQTDSF